MSRKKISQFLRYGKRIPETDTPVFWAATTRLSVSETPVQSDKTLLVLKDSYANCYLPFLATQYRKIVAVDPRYYYGDLEELMQV